MNKSDINTIKGWISSCKSAEQFDIIRVHVDLLFDTGKVTPAGFKELIKCLAVKLDAMQAELNRIRFGMMPHKVVNVFQIEPEVAIHNIFTSPGPDAPIQELANNIP